VLYSNSCLPRSCFIYHRFFSQSKYASFQRQLNLYGFSRLAHGKDKGAYFHSLFIRGKPSLVRGMVRRKVKGTKVRRPMAPSEEPDFYAPQWQVENLIVEVIPTSTKSVASTAVAVSPQNCPGTKADVAPSMPTRIELDSAPVENIQDGDLCIFSGSFFHYLETNMDDVPWGPAPKIPLQAPSALVDPNRVTCTGSNMCSV
jgi:hypothetical protein